MMPPEKMAEIGEAMAAAVKADHDDNLAVHRALWEAKVARIAELEADLRDTMRAVLYHFGWDGAHKVTTTVLAEKAKR